MGILQSNARTLSVNVGGIGSGHVLAIDVPKQEQNQWCWCAVTVGVRHYYHPALGMSQCTAANEILHVSNACINPRDKNVNKMLSLDQALSTYGLLNGGPIERPLTFQEVMAQIDSKRPLGARILFLKDGRGHFVVIRGYRGGGLNPPTLLIDDPLFGETDIPFTQFSSRYRGSGQWTATYCTQPAAIV